MNIPPYWVTSTREIAGMRFRLHGSSRSGMGEAHARMALREDLFRRLYEEESLPPQACREQLADLLRQERGEDYEVELFEPTLERLSEQRIVTRNRYGAEVLNSTELCFVDVDDFPPGLWERLVSLFSGRSCRAEDLLLAELQRLHREQPDLSARLYRTAGGWRIMLAAEGLTLQSPRMEQLCQRLKADPLYVALCLKQQCWRARLTPKPGRLHAHLGRYPRRSASDTPAAGEEEWLARYAEASAGRAVCRLVECFGAPIRHALVNWHDERTAALHPDVPLA